MCLVEQSIIIINSFSTTLRVLIIDVEHRLQRVCKLVSNHAAIACCTRMHPEGPDRIIYGPSIGPAFGSALAVGVVHHDHVLVEVGFGRWTRVNHAHFHTTVVDVLHGVENLLWVEA